MSETREEPMCGNCGIGLSECRRSWRGIEHGLGDCITQLRRKAKRDAEELAAQQATIAAQAEEIRRLTQACADQLLETKAAEQSGFQTADQLTQEIAQLRAAYDERGLALGAIATQVASMMQGSDHEAVVAAVKQLRAERDAARTALMRITGISFGAENNFSVAWEIATNTLDALDAARAQAGTETPQPDYRKFARRILRAFPTQETESIQEIGLETGVLIEVEATEPCGESCVCAEFGFPTKCYRMAGTEGK